MWGPVLVPVWIAAIVAVVWLWARFAGRRSRLARMVLDERQRLIDNEITDMTLQAIRNEDALADIHRIWTEHDREAGR